MATRILVVDDEKLIRWALRERLEKEGYEVLDAADGAAASQIIAEQEFDLALLDLCLPDSDGLTLMRQAHARFPEIPAIIITAYSSVDSAVDAMKQGAFDYVTKPFNLDELVITVRRTTESAALRRQFSEQVREQKARFGLANLVGKSAPMVEIKNLVQRIARSETTTVLLLGESGTGKDMIARAVHYESGRVEKPFVDITCTALPEQLLESELFGYEKGAFTDAKVQKKGLFEIASDGTVFLDEIGDMRPSLQAKLLRVLEERTFKRLGGTKDIHVDVRIIAATNRDIDDLMRQGRFREDLYYRLSTVPIYIPALRERREDIPLLATHFLNTYSYEFHRAFRELSPDAVERLLNYEWPGNVRELRNVIERAALLCSGDLITADDLVLGRSALRGVTASEPATLRLPEKGCRLDDVERELLKQALERTQWNQVRAASLLGITRDQVRYKMAKYGLSK